MFRKKKDFNVEAENMFHDLKHNSDIDELKSLRLVYRYDIEGLSVDEFARACDLVFMIRQ